MISLGANQCPTIRFQEPNDFANLQGHKSTLAQRLTPMGAIPPRAHNKGESSPPPSRPQEHLRFIPQKMDRPAGGGEVSPKCVDGVAALMNVLVRLVTGDGERP